MTTAEDVERARQSGIGTRFPAWVVAVLRSRDAARVRQEATKARREVVASPVYADEWRRIADALEARAGELERKP